MSYTSGMTGKELKSMERTRRWKKMKSMRLLYLFLLVPVSLMVVFKYVPMYGVIIAFKDYKAKFGIMGSPWNNFQHFKHLFSDVLFERAFWNTLRLSLESIAFTFVVPIVFALLLNEIKNPKYKKVVQTVSYMPHFLSWIIVSLVVYQVLSPEVGILNVIITSLGGKAVYFQGNPYYFDAIYILSGLWKDVGWSSIIYLAAITSVNPELYESADLDGANRYHKAVYITVPSIAPVITIQFILSFSGIMSAGFDKVFNLYNGLVMSKADVLDTFSYRAGLVDGNYDYSTAIGLFQNVIGLVMVLLVNKISSKISEYALW